MTSKTLTRLVTKWRERLGLDHWTLHVRFATQEELGGDDGAFICGRVWPDLDALTAQVYIARESEIDAETRASLSLCSKSKTAAMEQTIIHELLHVRLDPMNRMRDDSNFETGLNHTAKALWEGWQK